MHKRLNNRKQKGFTIIELVIVIAVIAVLAAVLIPTFINLTAKANKAADESLVTNLNKALAIEEVDHEVNNMHDAVESLKREGYLASTLVTKSDQKLLYNLEENRFLLEEDKKSGVPDYKYWTIADSMPSEQKYSIYASDDFSATSVTGLEVGFDAGDCSNIASIAYTRTGEVEAHEVIIRTNSANTNLTINAEHDTVNHYDSVGKVDAQKIDMNCYNEYGKAAYVKLSQGKVVAKAGGTISVVFATNSDASKVQVIKEKGTIEAAYTTAAEIDTANRAAGGIELTYTVNNQPVTEEVVNTYAEAAVEENIIEEVEASGLYEVRIGTTGYETIDAARAAAKSGDTIALVKDINLGVDDSCYGWDKERFSLDLNGHTMKTISEKGITLNNNGYTTGVFYMAEFLEPVSISGGSIISKYGTAIYIAGNTASNIVTIENVIATNEQYANQGGATSYASALRVTSEGHVLIKSGTFSGYNAVDLGSGGKADTCTIEGGTFIGRLTVNSPAQLIIEGGTFDHDPSEFVASGYHATNNGNGTWTVTANN